jgi:nitrile hydratase accessory protein
MTRDAVLEGAPRSNGALVFDEPWQARAFGLAVALVEGRRLAWDAFRSRLVTAIADDPSRPYWESWLAALEEWVAGDPLLTPRV